MKLRNILINAMLILACMCFGMIFMILLDNYTENKNQLSISYTEMKASEYKMLTEQYKMESIKLRRDFEEVRLKAYIQAYGGK